MHAVQTNIQMKLEIVITFFSLLFKIIAEKRTQTRITSTSFKWKKACKTPVYKLVSYKENTITSCSWLHLLLMHCLTFIVLILKPLVFVYKTGAKVLEIDISSFSVQVNSKAFLIYHSADMVSIIMYAFQTSPYNLLNLRVWNIFHKVLWITYLHTNIGSGAHPSR